MTEREKRELHLILGHYVNLLDRPEIKDKCTPVELLANKDLQSIAVKNMDRIAELEAETERLRAALKPFASMAESYEYDPDALVVLSYGGTVLDVRNLREARTALKGGEG